MTPSLSAGPTPLGPNDPPVCGYGIRQAIDTARRLPISTPWAALLWTVTVAVTGTAAGLIASDRGALSAVVGAVVGVLIATALVWLALALWLSSPLSQGFHWDQRIERYTPRGAGDTKTHTIMSLRSRHLHLAREIVCEVTDPLGRTYTHAWRSPYGAGPLPIRKNDGPTIAYPDEFGRPDEPDTPPPRPGTCRVRWILQPLPGGRGRVLHTSRWDAKA